MEKILLVLAVLVCAVLCFVGGYYSSRRCYGTGDCHLFTKNQDGGFDDGKHQWLVECNDGEGAVAVRDDDTHFEGLSGLWCSFLFPLKQATRGVYPYYPTCVVRNLTDGEYHCRSDSDGTNKTELFVSGIYTAPVSGQVFVPALMKCCQTPAGYRVDNRRCYYKKTFDRFGEHYTGEWLVKCDTHHVMTGIGKDINPWDNKEHFTWIQCCPFLYADYQDPTLSNSFLSLAGASSNPLYDNLVEAVLGDHKTSNVLAPSARMDVPSAMVDLAAGYRAPPSLLPPVKSVYDPVAALFRTINGQTGKWANAAKNDDSYLYPYLAEAFPKNDRYATASTTNFQYIQPLLNNSRVVAEPDVKTLSGPLDSSAMSAIQQAASVAAYNQFVTTYSQLLESYSKKDLTPRQDNQGLSSQFAGLNRPELEQRTNLGYDERSEPLLPLGIATAQHIRANYVTPPLPTGLQNYIHLASKNPGFVMSQLYNNSPVVTLANPAWSNPYRPVSDNSAYEPKLWHYNSENGPYAWDYQNSGPEVQMVGLLEQQRNSQLKETELLEAYFRRLADRKKPTAPTYLETIYQISQTTEGPNTAGKQPPATNITTVTISRNSDDAGTNRTTLTVASNSTQSQ